MKQTARLQQRNQPIAVTRVAQWPFHSRTASIWTTRPQSPSPQSDLNAVDRFWNWTFQRAKNCENLQRTEKRILKHRELRRVRCKKLFTEQYQRSRKSPKLKSITFALEMNRESGENFNTWCALNWLRLAVADARRRPLQRAPSARRKLLRVWTCSREHNPCTWAAHPHACDR